eukprot:CAMPEP_0169119066 /NCGR_PEP_ID=MMETSP1015-20121227/31345_1 /TAXON_ID=342587 /ORGANISM="Karlodinium micrum, Strain CCMP2283" /LENGTH=264 /DNA_ID=CAMNT_0009181895 /DNA_START=24 /DNA_END=818 /DNA_ORIENTATION=+
MGISLGIFGDEAERALEEIPSNSSEWTEVEDLIRQRSRNYHIKYKKEVTLKRLWRVMPTELWSKSEADALQYGNMMRLFHGTSPPNAKSIVMNGFSLPSKAGMFGKGIYFAKTPLKSVQYARKATPTFGLWNRVTGWFYTDDDGPTGEHQAMLVCDVYLGSARRVSWPNSQINNASDIRPSWCSSVFCCSRRKYDSIYAPGTPHHCKTLCCCCYACCYAVAVSEYVVFDKCQGLPRYVVEFDTATCTRPTEKPPQAVIGAENAV